MRRFLIGLALAAAATPALAQSLTAPLGQAVRVPIRGMATDVVVGDAKIADVTVVGPGALFVSGRGYGSTNLVVMDGAGRTLFNGRVLVPRATAGEVTVIRGSTRTSAFCAPLCEELSEDAKRDLGSAAPAGAPSAAVGGLANAATALAAVSPAAPN